MRITTERLTLEPISLDFLESTYAYASDRESTRFICSKVIPVDTPS